MKEHFLCIDRVNKIAKEKDKNKKAEMPRKNNNNKIKQ